MKFLIKLLFCLFVKANDIEFIYNFLKAHHVGYIIDEEFRTKLEQGFIKFFKTNDVKSYIASFHDPHLNLARKKSNSKIIHRCKIIYINKNTVLIRIPSFYNLDENSFLKVLKLLPKLRKDKIVIFDIRGNCGGNSYYAIKLFEALYEVEMANYVQYILFKDEKITWRVSKENIAHIKTFGEQFLYIANAMEEKLLQNEEIFIEEQKLEEVLLPKQIVNSKIFILIDKFNASAALDFLDLFTTQGVILVGNEPTNFDTNYNEVRSVQLPSGLILTFPIKQYTNRKRMAYERYIPSISIAQFSKNLMYDFSL